MELKQQLQHLLEHLSSLGYTTRELIFTPPATLLEVRALEQCLNFPIPPSFRNALLEFSEHVQFHWFAPKKMKYPSPFRSNFCGRIHWSIGFTKQFNEDKNDWVEKAFPKPSNPYDAVWHNKLAFYEVGNGDYLAIDLNPSSYEQIVYLSHDDGEGHGHILANDFQDLLRRWEPLAFTGGEDWQWLPFTNSMTTPIDPSCENARTWRKLLRLAT